MYDRQKQLAESYRYQRTESRAEILRQQQEEAENLRKALALSLQAWYLRPIDLETELESTPGASSSTDLPPVGASSSSSAPAAAQP